MKLFFLTPLLFMLTFGGIKLEKRQLLGGKIEILVPTDFKKMDQETLNLKYPSAQRPTLVYTNEKASVNAAFNLTENPANQDLMESYQANFVTTFEQLYANAEWLDKGVQEVDGRKVGMLELVTPAVDTEIYNLIFFTNLNDKLLICSFNCTKEKQADWQKVAKEIMQSLSI